MSQTKSLETAFIEAFDRDLGLLQSGATSLGAPDAWTTSRREAIRAFADLGFPPRKSEAYKYTPVTKWMGNTPVLQTEKPVAANSLPFSGLTGTHIKTVNGQLSTPPASLPDGLTVTTLRQALETHPRLVQEHLDRIAQGTAGDVFSTLAAAFAPDGLFIHVARGATLTAPVYIHHAAVSPGAFIQPRVLVVAEENSEAHIVEHFPETGAGTVFENRIVDVDVATRARLRHLVVYERGPQARFVNGLHVHQQGESVFSTNNITLGGALVRNNLHFVPDGEHCETHLNGLYIARGGAHVDNHTLVDHVKPNCFSNELFKGIVEGGSTGVFNGKVMVRQDAQKINAYQSSKSIVMDDQSHVYAKPELEIYADDVRCSHGATTGELDDEALFYLRSRGIPERTARIILLEAFARDVVELIPLDEVRAYLNTRLGELLAD